MAIYKITNKINDKSYIGQTKQSNPYKRIQAHFRKTKPRSKSLIWEAIRKYGNENFQIEILDNTVDEILLNILEKEYIQKYNTFNPNGYNLQLGGHDQKVTKEIKENISKAVKNYYKNNKHPFKDKKFSKSHIENLSKVRKGFDSPARIEVREKMYQKTRIPIKAIHIETKQEYLFDSIKECADKLKLIASNVSATLNGTQNRKQHKGYKFQKI